MTMTRGPRVMRWGRWLCGCAVAVIGQGLPADHVFAQQQYTLLVTGASGGATFAARHNEWRATLVTALRNQPGFQDEHLVVLAETPGPGVGRASREGVRRAIARLAARMDDEAVLFVVLIGHGSFDGLDAKFNLVGPDLDAAEWDALLGSVRGRVAFVNTTSVSFPFMDRVSRSGRAIVTATESAAQRYDTVFPRFFVEAFVDRAADEDRNDRVSILEAFEYASRGVRRWYQQQGRLATERALIDDTGDGRGREADQPGSDGLVAARLYLAAGVFERRTVDDPVLSPLIARRTELLAEVDMLRAARLDRDPGAYQRELERLLIELAHTARRIRRASR